MKKILICINISLLVVIFTGILFLFLSKSPTAEDVFKKNQNSVVELKSQTGESLTSYGSAIFIKEDGTIVSNAHVVTYKQSGVYNEFELYEIGFSFEIDYKEVTLIKYDLNWDIAILKINNTEDVKYKTIKYADSSKISSGDKVYAIGNGMNHGIGINEGIISLPQVNIEYENNVRNVIQCDLIINEGSSGTL